jgi:replication-associated recombination protein RarA
MDIAIRKRPTTLDEFVGNSIVKEQFRKFFETNTLPHKLLFTGSSGTGKTTLSVIVMIYLKVNPSFNLHYVDCGAQKDIATARETVKKLAQPAFGGAKENVLVILEEVHNLSKSVQEVFLASLENPKDNQYYIATTDQADKSLLNTFRSRFTEFMLSPLTDEEMVNDLLHPVVLDGNWDVPRSVMYQIASLSNGNNRRALSILESVSILPRDNQEAFLNTFTQSTEEGTPLYKAVDRLIKYPITDFLRDYQATMNIMVHSGKSPEEIRQYLLAVCTKNLKAPNNTQSLVRCAMLTDALHNTHCYGEQGWAVLGKCLVEFFQNFFENPLDK